MLYGYRWRKKKQEERDAFLIARLVNPHVKRRVKPADFLPKNKPQTLATPEERERALEGALGERTKGAAERHQQAAPLKAFLEKRKAKKS